MEKKILYVDMDNVLVDFSSGLRQQNPETLNEYSNREDEIPHIFGLMKPIPGALEGFGALSNHFDTYILTTSPWENETALADKLNWVKKHLGREAYKRLIISHNKHLNKGDFLIDDRPKHNGVDKFEGEIIHFGSERFPDWPTVKEYLFAKLNDHSEYKIPDGTTIGHVHLKVSNLQKSLDFYCGLLGFEITTTYGNQAAFISAGGYHHHIGLNTWHSKDKAPAPISNPGLYHTAILFPKRSDLALAVKRLLDTDYPLTGAADHGVSEAIYLNDPDGIGLELYWDRPKNEWPKSPDGSLEMYTKKLDLEDLLAIL